MKISNVEIAKKLIENETISQNYTYEQLLAHIDIGRTPAEESRFCKKTIISDYLDGFLEEIDARNN